jgi:hypothetical protein
LYLRFDQAGGATTQPNEYVVDENVTWVCALGRVKDNTMTAEYYAQMFKLPTVTRLDEAAVEVGSPWTTVGGWDGGYVDSASQQAFPWNRRGIAEGGFYWSDGTTTNYESMLHVANNPSDPHYMVSRRIHDEATFPRAAELTLINSSGEGRATSSTYDFTAGDVGKTIRVENATDAANNTSKVITDVLSPGGGAGTSTAVLDSAWAVAPDSGGAVTWRLRDVPEVSYVVSTIIIYDQYVGQATWTLLSSRDAGISWDVVKQGLDLNAVAADSLISVRRDPGIYMVGQYLNPTYGDYNVNGQAVPHSVMFDLTGPEMTSDQRRRTHWKIVRGNPWGGNSTAHPITVLLLDENYSPAISSDLIPADRTDPLFFGMKPTLRAVMHESVGAVTIGQSSAMPFSFGDAVNEAGAGYWIQDDTDLAAYANTSKVTSSAATFTWRDETRRIRVPAANVQLAVEETYSGFMTVVSVDDSKTLTVERTFESQANGTFATVTDNGGAAQFNAAGHTLANGDAVTISGGTAYDGIGRAANVVAGTSFELAGVTYGATASGAWDKGQTGLTWATLNFGATDRVRFSDTTTLYRYLSRPLAVVSYEIVDVPSTNQILTSTMDIPSSVTSSFFVEREFETVFRDNWTQGSNDLENGDLNAFYSSRNGIFGVSDEAQFNTIAKDSSSRSASTAVDSDGDGWVDTVTLTGFNISDAADGDWLLLYSPLTAPTEFRRWYKVKASTPGANTVLDVYEDEVPPDDTFLWRLARKRDMKMRIVSNVVAVREPI